VLADGFVRDEQALCDGAVGASLGHQLEHFPLTCRQPGDRLIAGAPDQQLGDHLRVHHRAAARDGTDRVDKLVVGEHPVLQQIADGARPVGKQLPCVELFDIL